MKELKIKKAITILFASFFLIISCSDEATFELDENINSTADLTNTQTSDAAIVINAIAASINEFNDPVFLKGVDQQTIDNAIVKYGLDNLSTGFTRDPKVINQIIADVGEAFEIGPENYINSLPYAAYTKEILLIQINGRAVSDLEKQREFSGISKEEQEVLLFNNELIEETEKAASNDNTRSLTRLNCNNHDDPHGCQVGHSIGSAVGSVAGTIICGNLCGAVGGFIGGLIGGAIGGKQ